MTLAETMVINDLLAAGRCIAEQLARDAVRFTAASLTADERAFMAALAAYDAMRTSPQNANTPTAVPVLNSEVL